MVGYDEDGHHAKIAGRVAAQEHGKVRQSPRSQSRPIRAPGVPRSERTVRRPGPNLDPDCRCCGEGSTATAFPQSRHRYHFISVVPAKRKIIPAPTNQSISHPIQRNQVPYGIPAIASTPIVTPLVGITKLQSPSPN
jgi:hypothetical protein